MPPAEYMMHAARLVKAGRMDDAVFWFYVGQLRWRFDLAAHPEQDPTGGPALLASLMDVLGTPINAYAFGDIPRLTAVWDAVLAWDAAHDNGSTSKTRYAAAWEKQRAGLRSLRADTLARRAEIERTRVENGLANRTAAGAGRPAG